MVYLLESFHDGSGTVYEAIWTNHGKIEYEGIPKYV
jgi:hypothetical protein